MLTHAPKTSVAERSHAVVPPLTEPPRYLGLARQRMKLQAEFFRLVIDPRELLAPFDHIPGVLYFVKDHLFQMMAISHEAVQRLGFQDEEEVIGRTDHEYLPMDLADRYREDDLWVMQNQKPRRNILEMWFTPEGARDWIVTDKYPLRNPQGKIVGLIGTIQPFAARRKLLAELGPVGQAADYIRANLRESIMLSELARRCECSEHQLQQLFHRIFGMTIQRFITYSRVHASIPYLLNSGRSFTDIGVRFGFADAGSFENKFREVTGLTPENYRDRYSASFCR